MKQVIAKLNSDDEIRSMVSYFRQDRREIFDCNEQIDLIAFKDHCDFLMQEVEEVKSNKLKGEYKAYMKAMSFYEECLTFRDLEMVLDTLKLDIPLYLTEDRAN